MLHGGATFPVSESLKSMNFVHDCVVGGANSRDHVHSMEVLAAITPNDVLR